MAANKAAGDKKPKVEDTSHEPAKHIVETARLASSVENAKNPDKEHSAQQPFGNWFIVPASPAKPL